jgi:hypothetical protein
MTSPLSDAMGSAMLSLLQAGRIAPDSGANPQDAPAGGDFGRLLDNLSDKTDAPPADAEEEMAAPLTNASPFSLRFLLTADASPETAAAIPLVDAALAAPIESAPSNEEDVGRAAQAARAEGPQGAFLAPAAPLPPLQTPPPPPPPATAQLSAAQPGSSQAPDAAAVAPAPARALAQPLAAHQLAPAPQSAAQPTSRSAAFLSPLAPPASGASPSGTDAGAAREPSLDHVQGPAVAIPDKQRRLQDARDIATPRELSEPRQDGGEGRETPNVSSSDAREDRAAATPVEGISIKLAPSSELAPSPLFKINVGEIVTHLPVVVAQTLVASPGADSAGADASAAAHTAAPTFEKPAEVVKILRFQVEPAALGTIAVRMRVTHAKVEIQLDAESPRTSTLLMDARDNLTSAIGEKGMTLESFKVNLSPPVSAVASGQDRAGVDDQTARFASQRGFDNDQRSDQRRQHQSPARQRQRRDETPAQTGPLGVIL